MSATDPGLPAAVRVALLAREGQARQQLRGALLGAGAQIALEDDPNALDADALAASRPHAVLVALEPAIEDALLRLDRVLADPGLTVIYDEADLASSRQGWDAQRWTRHLSAKLHGHRDVLPPGAEAELPQSPAPGRPQAPAFVEDAVLEQHLDQAAAQSGSLPDEHGLGSTLTLADADADAHAQPADAFAIDPDTWTPPPLPSRLELVDDPVPAITADAPDAPSLRPDPAATPVAQARSGPRPPSISQLSLVEDFQVATPVRAAATVPPPLPPGFGSLNLELEALESPEPAAVAEDVPGSKVAGAVLLSAGIGGPDAVRRVLAGLPASLSLPVLVHLRLDGGLYDNLTKQIQRVSPLPVLLARAGMAARAGYVYVVPDEVAAEAVDGMVCFAKGRTDVPRLLGALPPDKTAVLLLSGADAALAEPALMLGARGALVGGQSLQGCYDWAAAQALEHGGGATASPEALAQRVIEHLGG